MNEPGAVSLSDQAPDLFEEIAHDELEICRARARVQALTGPPDYLTEAENFTLDLTRPSFTGYCDGQVCCCAKLQIAGTYSDGEFCFSWNDAAIPEAAWREIKEVCSELEPLVPLLSRKRLACLKESAERLVQWIAVQMFYTGALVVADRDRLLYLVLLLSPGAVPDESAAPVVWCSYCGTSDWRVARPFRVAPTCCICSECVLSFKQVLEALEQAEMSSSPGSPSVSSPADTDVDPSKTPCLLCGVKAPRIFADGGAVCHECLKSADFEDVVP